MKFYHNILLTLAILCLAPACKTQKKSAVETKITPVEIANITLYNQPADTIRKYIVGHRWQLQYSYGGITGNDKNTADGIYYTFMQDGKMKVETPANTETNPYSLEKKRDIFTGDSTYVITGALQWKVEGIFNDTLKLSDNYVDGYHYALIRAK